jgi:hypothetical protein
MTPALRLSKYERFEPESETLLVLAQSLAKEVNYAISSRYARKKVEERKKTSSSKDGAKLASHTNQPRWTPEKSVAGSPGLRADKCSLDVSKQQFVICPGGLRGSGRATSGLWEGRWVRQASRPYWKNASYCSLPPSRSSRRTDRRRANGRS